jgi:hypothetical protein
MSPDTAGSAAAWLCGVAYTAAGDKPPPYILMDASIRIASASRAPDASAPSGQSTVSRSLTEGTSARPRIVVQWRHEGHGDRVVRPGADCLWGEPREPRRGATRTAERACSDEQRRPGRTSARPAPPRGLRGSARRALGRPSRRERSGASGAPLRDDGRERDDSPLGRDVWSDGRRPGARRGGACDAHRARDARASRSNRVCGGREHARTAPRPRPSRTSSSSARRWE